MAVAQEASSAVRLEPTASRAAERLFQEHSGWIYAYCLRLLRSRQEAEDALQVTYLNACRSLNSGFRPRADSAWLMTVAHNVCITRLRSSGRRARLEHPHDTAVLEDTIAAPERRADELIGLPEALAALPDQQRQAILLREWQGLSYREVAAKLRLTQAAVETLIFRARRSLAAALEDPARRGSQAVRGLGFGGFGTGLKSLLGGSAAVKLAALAAVAATATVVATDPVGWHRLGVPESARSARAAEAPRPATPAGSSTHRAATEAAEQRDHELHGNAGRARAHGARPGGALGKEKAHPKTGKKAHPRAGKKTHPQLGKKANPHGGAARGAENGKSAEAPGKPIAAGSGLPPSHAVAHGRGGAKGKNK